MRRSQIFELQEIYIHDDQKRGDQNRPRIDHVPKKAGHLYLGFIAKGFDHEIGGVSDVAVGSHED